MKNRRQCAWLSVPAGMRRTAATSNRRPAGIRSGTYWVMRWMLSEGGEIKTMNGMTHDIPRWDLLIAHPPCTYLTNSSAVWLFDKNHRIKDHLREIKGWAARNFFFAMLHAPIDRIAVENPVPQKYFHLPPYTQIIEPYQYGEPWKKRTCLWLENLPDLRPTKIVEPHGLWVGGCGGQDKEKRKLMTQYTLKSNRSQKQRSKTFPGIAAAMADQWGSLETGD